MNANQFNFDLKGLALVLIVGIGGVTFCAGALANDDPLWFLPFFDATPTQIVVHLNGCDAKLSQGTPGFQNLTDAINSALSQIDGYENGFGLSPQTLAEYRTVGRSVEIFYAQPVRVHSPYRTGHPDNLLIPLSGTFGETRSLFGGRDGDYWGGALRLKTTAGIRGAIENVACPR